MSSTGVLSSTGVPVAHPCLFTRFIRSGLERSQRPVMRTRFFTSASQPRSKCSHLRAFCLLPLPWLLHLRLSLRLTLGLTTPSSNRRASSRCANNRSSIRRSLQSCSTGTAGTAGLDHFSLRPFGLAQRSERKRSPRRTSVSRS